VPLTFSSLNLNLFVAANNIAANDAALPAGLLEIAAASWSIPTVSGSRVDKNSMSLLEQKVLLFIIF